MMQHPLMPLRYFEDLDPKIVQKRHRQFIAQLLSRPSSHPKNHKKNAQAKLARRPQIEARHRRQKKNAGKKK